MATEFKFGCCVVADMRLCVCPFGKSSSFRTLSHVSHLEPLPVPLLRSVFVCLWLCFWVGCGVLCSFVCCVCGVGCFLFSFGLAHKRVGDTITFG